MDIRQLVIDKKEYFYADKKIALRIGYGVNERYIRCMAASIASICYHNSDIGLSFYVITDSLSEESLRRFRFMAEKFKIDINIYMIESKKLLDNLPTKSHFPLAIYYRYILPLLLCEGFILYLDADVINLKSLKDVISIEFQDKIIAAVRDLPWMERKRCMALGIEKMYFNSGVIYMDIKKWCEAKIFERSLALLQSEPDKFRYPDQDVLNLLLQDKVVYLAQKYNCLDFSEADKDSTVLLHFAAHPKPWNIAWPISKACNSFNSNIYAKYEAMTPWCDETLQMPANDKERKIYAKCLWRKQRYPEAIEWFVKYLLYKFK